MKFYLSWDDVYNWTLDLSRQLEVPDVIVPVVRGGMIPGVILSHMLQVPKVVPLVYQTRDNIDDTDFSPLISLLDQDKKVLIVEDIVDSGKTMFNIQAVIKSYGIVTYCSLVKRKETVCPVFFGRELSNFDWVVFPWESK